MVAAMNFILGRGSEARFGQVFEDSYESRLCLFVICVFVFCDSFRVNIQ